MTAGHSSFTALGSHVRNFPWGAKFLDSSEVPGTGLAPTFEANSVGGTFPIFSMKLTVTVRWPPRFDLAPAGRQTQHQIMYPRIVPANSADELAVRLAFAFVHVRVVCVYRVADVWVAHDTERTSGF